MLAMRRLPVFVGQCDRQREEPKFEAEANEVWRWCVCNDAPVFYVGSPAKVWRVLQRVSFGLTQSEAVSSVRRR